MSFPLWSRTAWYPYFHSLPSHYGPEQPDILTFIPFLLTMVQNSLISLLSFPSFPLWSRIAWCPNIRSEWVSEQKYEHRGAREQSKQCLASEWVSNMRKNQTASGPVLMPWFLFALNHSASSFSSSSDVAPVLFFCCSFSSVLLYVLPFGAPLHTLWCSFPCPFLVPCRFHSLSWCVYPPFMNIATIISPFPQF